MKKGRNESIRTHLLWPLLVLLIIQALIMAGMVLFGGVSKKLKNNEIHILSENTDNTRLYLEKETIHQWINVVNDSGSMASEIQSVLDEQHKDASCISSDYDLNREIADGIMNRAVDLMRRSYGTGIFVVLDGPARRTVRKIRRPGFTYAIPIPAGAIIRIIRPCFWSGGFLPLPINTGFLWIPSGTWALT